MVESDSEEEPEDIPIIEIESEMPSFTRDEVYEMDPFLKRRREAKEFDIDGLQSQEQHKARYSRLQKNLNEKMLMDRLGEPTTKTVVEQLESIVEHPEGYIQHQIVKGEDGNSKMF